jgi:hypothetical protein
MTMGMVMSSVERIIVGVASLIALIGWLRWVGEASSHDDKLRTQRPTGPPKYQRPSNEPPEANRQIYNDVANLTPEAQGRVINVNQTDYENAKPTELLFSGRHE